MPNFCAVTPQVPQTVDTVSSRFRIDRASDKHLVCRLLHESAITAEQDHGLRCTRRCDCAPVDQRLEPDNLRMAGVLFILVRIVQVLAGAASSFEYEDMPL